MPTPRRPFKDYTNLLSYTSEMNKYILILAKQRAFPATKTHSEPDTWASKKPGVIILSRTQQNPLVNNTDTKEGKIARLIRKKCNKKSAFDPPAPLYRVRGGFISRPTSRQISWPTQFVDVSSFFSFLAEAFIFRQH